MNTKLQDAVMDILVKCKGKDSISSLREALYCKGWKHLGNNLSDFEKLLEDNGFTLERVYTKRSVNTNYPMLRQTNVTM